MQFVIVLVTPVAQWAAQGKGLVVSSSKFVFGKGGLKRQSCVEVYEALAGGLTSTSSCIFIYFSKSVVHLFTADGSLSFQ